MHTAFVFLQESKTICKVVAIPVKFTYKIRRKQFVNSLDPLWFDLEYGA